MSKEKVFIVISHKHTPKKGTKSSNKQKQVEWDVTESVEFVNQLRNKHLTMSSAVGDYINRKMLTGSRHGMGDYDKFEEYVRTKYDKQMAELDAAYRAQQVVVEDSPEVFSDQFGNIRARTVFDHA
jgi:hypothetical protein